MKEESGMEILEALMENTQAVLRKIIKENKELRIRLVFLEKENEYYTNRRKGLGLVNIGRRDERSNNTI